MVVTANLGFPRLGADRALKFALERHWRGEDPGAARLRDTAAELRARHWRLQAERGIDRIPVGDQSLYDHVLDTAVTVGAVPDRFGGEPFDPWPADGGGGDGGGGALDRYFALARGAEGRPALEMTKWFDTNYHYLVPELAAGQRFAYTSRRLVRELAEARELGVDGRPVVLGPVTFLRLAKRDDGGDPLDLLDALVPVYEELLADLAAAGATAVQVDEPLLALDLDAAATAAYGRAYPALRAAAPGVELAVASYFGGLGGNAATALGLPVDVLHVDLVRDPGQLDALAERAPAGLSLSLGLVDGRNIWRSDLVARLDLARRAVARLGPERVQVAPSCSLLHLPLGLDGEDGGPLDPELRSWLAFATERLDEVATLGRALVGDADPGGADAAVAEALAANAAAVASRRTSTRVRRPDVRTRLAAVTPDMDRRITPHAERRVLQHKALDLPVLPTTTIGSFPQTPEVRRVRARHRRGEVGVAEYEAALEAETAACVRRQEELGLDLLVHGEFERTDMVEYFGEQLDGFATSANGWVQSYGSRGVKPPILFGDVARPAPMTVRWATYAAGLTDRPMKGMLTGPVTILAWSFVRDDQPEADTARQVALALRDEVADLEAAGLHAIQVDEPALRETLPLRAADRPGYLAWAAEAFRLATSGVADEVQVHTHMCYAEFGDILDAIVALDADVISMEASRSGMALLDELAGAGYPNEIGPGVWDIHSPRVPAQAEIEGLLDRALAVFGPEQLWVNPDCGLKTRGWPEVTESLAHMVGAARRVRERLRGR
jgi:5-methyltetrahydropteroyltriglutamate--homocysteine methyltransferase